VEIKLRQLYGRQVFDAVLPSRVAYVEAPYQLLPITHLAPRSEEADLIRSVLDELIRRINAADALLGHQLAEAG
jgi:cellulose biosynthesis protein BcsQ